MSKYSSTVIVMMISLSFVIELLGGVGGTKVIVGGLTSTISSASDWVLKLYSTLSF